MVTVRLLDKKTLRRHEQKVRIVWNGRGQNRLAAKLRTQHAIEIGLRRIRGT